jgi:hypothetical protein
MRRFLLKLFRRRTMERDTEVELAFHREMAAAHGNPTPFGNSTVIKEQGREPWRFNTVENLWRDATDAVRGLRRNPALVASALLSLMLGIGVNSAIFSLGAEFLFSQPSVRDPDSCSRYAWAETAMHSPRLSSSFGKAEYLRTSRESSPNHSSIGTTASKHAGYSQSRRRRTIFRRSVFRCSTAADSCPAIRMKSWC